MRQSSVLVIVVTEQSDDVAFLNKTLRDAGHRVNCRGLSRLEDLEQALEHEVPHLIVFFPDHHAASLRQIVAIKTAYALMSPLILIRAQASESDISDTMEAGAQDLVSQDQLARICCVCERELKAFRLERALNDTLTAATQYKQQLQSLMSGSAEAIAQVQEGIVVEANQAWTDIFADSDPEQALGPLMDFFAESSQPALKGALIASAKGQWPDKALRADVPIGDGRSAPVELELEPSTFDGEPATRLKLLRRDEEAGEPTPETLVQRALTTDPSTGLFQRHQFLELLTDKLDQRNPGGARALALIRPDRFGDVEQDVGPVASEEILGQLADMIAGLKSDQDLAGRFGGNVFAIVLERGTLRDIEAWAENTVRCIGESIFAAADRSVSLTCSIGMAELGDSSDRVETLIRTALQAVRHARSSGGNRIIIEETEDLTIRTQKLDALWVHQIKSALAAGRFRLMHMNIASLSGQSERMFDTFVRMIDESHDEIPASDFMGTAERMDMARPIDRWIIDASIDFCASHASDLVFVKLSLDSVLDSTLRDWICEKVAKSGVRPQNLCFQVSEGDAARYQNQTVALAENLRGRGFRFAIEQFGIGRDPIRILTSVPMDFVKLDGSLIQIVANDSEVQRQISQVVSQAQQHSIQTIAARVENANTMAVLFQLGVGYMQGHYVHEPEVVLEEVV